MTDPAREKFSFLLLGKRLAQLVAVVAAVVILYTEGATAFFNTQEAIKAKAIAGNAAIVAGAFHVLCPEMKPIMFGTAGQRG